MHRHHRLVLMEYCLIDPQTFNVSFELPSRVTPFSLSHRKYQRGTAEVNYLTTIETNWERFQRRSCLRAIGKRTSVGCHKERLLSEGFQSILDGHRYDDTRQLLSSFMFLLVMKLMRIKRMMLNIAVIEN